MKAWKAEFHIFRDVVFRKLNQDDRLLPKWPACSAWQRIAWSEFIGESFWCPDPIGAFSGCSAPVLASSMAPCWPSVHISLSMKDVQERPILAVLALLGTATLAYFLALFCVLRQGTSDRQLPDQERADDGRALRVVWFFAIAYRLILLPSAPIQEIDFFRYLWDGRAGGARIQPVSL